MTSGVCVWQVTGLAMCKLNKNAMLRTRSSTYWRHQRADQLFHDYHKIPKEALKVLLLLLLLLFIFLLLLLFIFLLLLLFLFLLLLLLVIIVVVGVVVVVLDLLLLPLLYNLLLIRLLLLVARVSCYRSCQGYMACCGGSLCSFHSRHDFVLRLSNSSKNRSRLLLRALDNHHRNLAGPFAGRLLFVHMLMAALAGPF